MTVKKGCITVRVAAEEGYNGGDVAAFKKFVIPISHLHHPLFRSLLDSAREVYGYPSSGPLRLPCSVDEFLHVRWLIERESSSSSSAHHHHSHSPRRSLSLSSC